MKKGLKEGFATLVDIIQGAYIGAVCELEKTGRKDEIPLLKEMFIDAFGKEYLPIEIPGLLNNQDGLV